ncbi:hypothetical protein KR038_010873 [Drosophila bunnanda]|nr:hypothetical protein KR038_010873 [Drosophila bunnanda]
MFKRPYNTPPSNHRTQNTNNNNPNQNQTKNPVQDDLQRRQAEANRIYYEEIILKQANARACARLAGSNSKGCSRSSNISSSSSSSGSFVDQFAEFVVHSSRTTTPMSSDPMSHVPTPPTNNANDVSSLLPPKTNSSSTSSNNNNVSVVSSSGGNGLKATAKKSSSVILLAARGAGAGKHPPISILNGSSKVATGAGGVTLVRVNNSNRNQRQVIVATEAAAAAAEQERQQLASEEEELAEEEELDEDLDEDAAALGALSSSTAQILRKFRIPKGTAVTAKSSGDNYLAMPTPTPSPPGGVVSVVSSGMDADGGYIENEDDIIEELNEDDLVEEIIDEEPCEEQPELQEEVPTSATEHDGLANAGAMLLAPQPQPQPPPLQLQTVASNGTVTCFNLPANTILLQSADGSIIAATQVPHPSKAGHQQLIALPGNVALAAEPVTQTAAAATPQATQTLLLTADGTAIPILATGTPQQPQPQPQQQQQQAAAAAAQLFAA